jgi:hypothetical protein
MCTTLLRHGLTVDKEFCDLEELLARVQSREYWDRVETLCSDMFWETTLWFEHLKISFSGQIQMGSLPRAALTPSFDCLHLDCN